MNSLRVGPHKLPDPLLPFNINPRDPVVPDLRLGDVFDTVV